MIICVFLTWFISECLLKSLKRYTQYLKPLDLVHFGHETRNSRFTFFLEKFREL